MKKLFVLIFFCHIALPYFEYKFSFSYNKLKPTFMSFIGHFLWEKIRLDKIGVSRELSEALTEGLTALTEHKEVQIYWN